jgi:hypothetical protein
MRISKSGKLVHQVAAFVPHFVGSETLFLQTDMSVYPGEFNPRSETEKIVAQFDGYIYQPSVTSQLKQC